MSKEKICKQETDKILLVEGIDDCHVVRNLCKAYGIIIPESFGIYECGSDDNILKRLNALISESDPGVTHLKKSQKGGRMTKFSQWHLYSTTKFSKPVLINTLVR